MNALRTSLSALLASFRDGWRVSPVIAVKSAARTGLAQASAYARERPALKRVIIAALGLAPSVRDRLWAALRRERDMRIDSEKEPVVGFTLAVEPRTLEEWRALVAPPTGVTLEK
jgi:hypothetical protein